MAYDSKSYWKGRSGGHETIGDNSEWVRRGQQHRENARRAAEASNKAFAAASEQIGNAFRPQAASSSSTPTRVIPNTESRSAHSTSYSGTYVNSRPSSSLSVFDANSWLEDTWLSGVHAFGCALASNIRVIAGLGALAGAGAGLSYGDYHPDHVFAAVMVGIGIGLAACMSSVIIGYTIKVVAVILSYLLMFVAYGVVCAAVLSGIAAVGYGVFYVLHQPATSATATVPAAHNPLP
jgi:hypothetical protein